MLSIARSKVSNPVFLAGLARISLSQSASYTTYIPKYENRDVPPQGNYTVEYFLDVIGRDCSKFASKFEKWDDLFTNDMEQLMQLGIPLAHARYINRKATALKLGIEPHPEKLTKQEKIQRKEWVRKGHGHISLIIPKPATEPTPSEFIYVPKP